MASIVINRQRMCPGVYLSVRPSEKALNLYVSLSVKWYGFVYLAWKCARENYSFKWYHYPKVIALIGWHTVRFVWDNRRLLRK